MGGSVHQVGPKVAKGLAELMYDRRLSNFRILPIGGSVHQVGPSGVKVLAELNYDGLQDEHKEARDDIVGEGHGLTEEDKSRINEPALGVNDGWRGGGVSPSALRDGLQKQQQPPGPAVRWERILSIRTLKVLLVEDDDSTRQVVSALLRNCSYEVTAVANGSQAWKILENPVNHTDLVLTEVVMPGSSGIGLLCKIMSHDTRKNIPVIMMSSNDSMGTVFKCLSKGAVDFLVKPIRKNELRNLWQHVWRRSHSSCGSVSESGIQTQKSARSQSDDDSNYNTSSNYDDNNASTGLNARDDSDHGSGTQSSWTKHAVEVDSPQPMSPSDQPGDPHDSTRAQVISDSQILYNKWVPMTTDEECQNEKKHADECMGKGLEIGLPNNEDDHHEAYPFEKASIKLQVASIDNKPDSDQKNEDDLGLESSNAFDEPSTKAVDLIGGMTNNTEAQPMKNNIHGCTNGFSKISECKEKNDDSLLELPSLQLSLKRLRSTGEVNNGAQDDRNVLKRSVQSAFSRYRTSAVSTQAPTGCEGSCSPLDHSSEAMKTESTQNMISNSNPGTAKQGSNGSSDNNDMGSTTRNVFINPAPYKEKAASTLVVKNIHPSAFRPVQLRASVPPKVMQEKVENIIAGTMLGQSIVVQHQIQMHNHYHHHFHGIEQQQQPPKHNDSSHKKSMASSDVFAGPFEGNGANYSVIISNSGSNHGSNGQNGSSPPVNAAGANVISDKCGVDQNRFAQREAALNKFRQKRKERNFGKKVRYQRRKLLAEQRPRVRGQFVRQSAQEYTSREADS